MSKSNVKTRAGRREHTLRTGLEPLDSGELEEEDIGVVG